jgi:PAS domain S-box-containing protein
MVMIDPTGTIVSLVATAPSIFGHDHSALIHRNVTTIIPPQHRDLHTAGLARAMNGGPVPASDPFEIPVLHADDTERLARARLHVLLSPDGVPVGALVIFSTDANGDARASDR